MDYSAFPIMRNNISTLKDCSLDSAHHLYLSTSASRVVNFDDVKTEYFSGMGMSDSKAYSVDVLARINGTDYCMIEFKSNLCGENPGINLKVRDSLLLLCSICKTTIDSTRKDIDFIVVYDDSRTNLSTSDKVAIAMANQSGTISSYGKYDKLEGYCFRKCHICSCEEFEKQFVPRITDII